ncbi:MAG TPA: carboxypeptidase-like regulatory domain-containing protein, partial [Candidatus Solibacter sp.]|nr:carboxypeptidase-like regulatory domain-containing protein [Candidatus Solibacter sp.]
MNRCVNLKGFRVSSWLLALSIACIATASAWAQATSAGTIGGLVTDQQNAAVAGADVKMVDPTTNSARTTITNEVGRYTVIN